MCMLELGHARPSRRSPPSARSRTSGRLLTLAPLDMALPSPSACTWPWPWRSARGMGGGSRPARQDSKSVMTVWPEVGTAHWRRALVLTSFALSWAFRVTTCATTACTTSRLSWNSQSRATRPRSAANVRHSASHAARWRGAASVSSQPWKSRKPSGCSTGAPTAAVKRATASRSAGVNRLWRGWRPRRFLPIGAAISVATPYAPVSTTCSIVALFVLLIGGGDVAGGDGWNVLAVVSWSVSGSGNAGGQGAGALYRMRASHASTRGGSGQNQREGRFAGFAGRIRVGGAFGGRDMWRRDAGACGAEAVM